MLRGPFVHHNRRTKLSELSSWEIDSWIDQYLDRPKTNAGNPLHPATSKTPPGSPPPPPPTPSHVRPHPRAYPGHSTPSSPPGLGNLTSGIALGVGLGYLTGSPWSLEHLTQTAAVCRECECGPWNYALLLSEVTDVERFSLERARGRGAGGKGGYKAVRGHSHLGNSPLSPPPRSTSPPPPPLPVLFPVTSLQPEERPKYHLGVNVDIFMSRTKRITVLPYMEYQKFDVVAMIVLAKCKQASEQ